LRGSGSAAAGDLFSLHLDMQPGDIAQERPGSERIRLMASLKILASSNVATSKYNAAFGRCQ
jgi:hypothetical protein